MSKNCKRCGCAISDGIHFNKGRDCISRGFCIDATCPFSDHLQSCKAAGSGTRKLDPNPTDDDAQIPCTCGKRRGIEMFIGRMDHTWDTEEIEIPGNTPAAKIKRVAITAMRAKLQAKGIETAFVGVYYIGS